MNWIDIANRWFGNIIYLYQEMQPIREKDNKLLCCEPPLSNPYKDLKRVVIQDESYVDNVDNNSFERHYLVTSKMC